MFDFMTGWIDQGGLLAIAALMFLENVFPPIPSELIMPLAGFLAAQGRMSLLAVIAVGTLGSVVGACFWYALGRAWGRERFLRFIDRWGLWLTLSRAEAERATAWFDRNAGMAVFLGRMVPGVRSLVSVPAGLNGMPLPAFLGWTALGSLIWTSFLALMGVVLRESYHRLDVWLNPLTTLVVVAVVGLYAWRVARGLLARRR